jgi:hypothetical protein
LDDSERHKLKRCYQLSSTLAVIPIAVILLSEPLLKERYGVCLIHWLNDDDVSLFN